MGENPYQSPVADNPPPAKADHRTNIFVKVFLVTLLIITPAIAGAFSPDGDAGETHMLMVCLLMGLVLYLLHRLK